MNSMDEWWNRFWADMIGRTSGPFAFRFLLQPTVAMLYAIRDGVKEAHAGRPAYFWSLMTGRGDRRERLHEGWAAVARVIGLGAVIDLIYQIMVFHRVYPLQLVVIVLLLAFVPYLLLRGPVSRIARHFMRTRA
jgi:hypothetical protein